MERNEILCYYKKQQGIWGVRCLVVQNIKFDQFKNELCSCIEWLGENNKHCCFKQNSFTFQKNHTIYCVEVLVFGTEKRIIIKCNKQISVKTLYLYLGDIRRYEYLFDGAFYLMKKCKADENEISEIIRSVELGYFQSARSMHKIQLELDDKEYKRYFLKWLKLQNKLGIINQMALFANCVNGIPADLRMSMLVECYEALGRKLERSHILSVIPESNTLRNVNCTNCGRTCPITIRGKKTLASYVNALISKYGKPIFSLEFRRRKSLISHIIKTRNKVFHVNSKQKKVLNGEQCGFYVVKLDWMFRYIVWLLMGYDQVKLDAAVSNEVHKFENNFQNLIY